MPRIAYVNGAYVPHRHAALHIDDRAVQFADSVYEVCGIQQGRMIDLERHLDRLDRSLEALSIASPMRRAALKIILHEVIRRNGVTTGVLYCQISRGVALRNHAFPAQPVTPGIIVTARSIDCSEQRRMQEEGCAIVTRPDIRWGHCDIKSTGLLPNILAKQSAREEGAYEAWLVDGEGFVTEGTSANAWILTEAGVLVTRPLDRHILGGITRAGVLESAEALGIPVEERRFSVDEAMMAREAFCSVSSAIVLPVVAIDGKSVGNGHPGETARILREHYLSHVEKSA